jgi:glycosyltransferase involved in cell wall biosynthesis
MAALRSGSDRIAPPASTFRCFFPTLLVVAFLPALKISIIIPAYNEERLIAETLHHANAGLAEFRRRGWEAELIVCNNNSTDRTAQLAEAAGATVVFEPLNQIGRARNRGASAATGDWLLFIDADSKASVELFGDVADEILSGRTLAGGSTVALEGQYRWASCGLGLWNGLSRCLRWVAGSFIFCEAEAFRTIGGFNNELFASEEVDLSKKLKQLAKERGKELTILNRHPLVTSARKLHLYSFREHAWFLTKTVFTFGKTLNNRDACHTWYDGRR